MKKGTFIVHCDWENIFDELCELEKAKLIMAIFAYVNRGEIPKLSKGSGVSIAFKSIMREIDNDEGWQNE